MTTSALRLGARLIASAAPRAQDAFLEGMSDRELRVLPHLFKFWAMPHQLPPGGDWPSWVILGERGAGKTRAGAEWVRSTVEGPVPRAKGWRGVWGSLAEPMIRRAR
jgi:phage terminase large subunit-like protein